MNKIRNFRKFAQLRAKDMAKKLSISTATLWNRENCPEALSIQRLQKFLQQYADILNATDMPFNREIEPEDLFIYEQK